jgi:polyisoprenoid-binding protein YceI
MARFRILPDRSQLVAEARSSLHPIRVQTTGLEGWLEAELADGQARLATPPGGHLEIGVERLKTGIGLYDSELERRLDARKYPRVRGEVRQMTGAPPSPVKLRGDLSFHGVTKSIEGDVRLRVVDERTIEIEGDTVLDMRDFGLDPPRILMLKVYPDITVHGKVVAEREG